MAAGPLGSYSCYFCSHKQFPIYYYQPPVTTLSTFMIFVSFSIFSAAVTGVCYVRPTRTIWVAAGTQEANMYDPKSGENVSSHTVTCVLVDTTSFCPEKNM